MINIKDETIKLLKEVNKKNNKEIENIEQVILFLGVFSIVLNDKKIFKKNKDLAFLLENKFGIELAEYAKKSRTIMIGKAEKVLLENYFDIGENLNTVYYLLKRFLEGEKLEISWEDIIKKELK